MSDEQPQVLVDLWSLLEHIKAPSTFACGGELPIILPGLNISGYGGVSLPLRERDATDILQHFHAVADVEQSKVLRIDASHIQLINKKFVDQINTLVRNIAVELGIDNDVKVEAQLYKLLLFAPEGIWQDNSEKTKGTFASLVVTLPSTFEGGTVTVAHNGIEMKFEQADTTFTTSYTAFYDDCNYNMRPITSGYRLALLFNIVSRSEEGPLPSAPKNDILFATKKILREWRASDIEQSKAVIILKHTKEYTSGLTYQALKEEDKAMAQLLQEAVKGEDFELYLGTLDFCQYKSRDEDDECDLSQLTELNGNSVKLKISVSSEDFYPSSALNDYNADSRTTTPGEKTEVLEYRRAVLMLFPKKKLADIICAGDDQYATAYLAELLEECTGINSRDAPQWQMATRMASILARHMYVIDASLLQSLCIIGDVRLVQKYLGRVAKHHVTTDLGQVCSALHECVTTFSWASLRDQIQEFATGLHTNNCLIFLAQFYSPNMDDPIGREVLSAIIHCVLENQDQLHSMISLNETYLSRAILLIRVIEPSLLSKFLLFIEKNSSMDLLSPTLIEVRKLESAIVECTEYVLLARKCIEFLQPRVDAAETREDDWSILTPLYCSCYKCEGIANFLRSPTETMYKHGIRTHHVFLAFGIYTHKAFKGLIELSDGGGTIFKVAKEVDSIKKIAAVDEERLTALRCIINEVKKTEERAAKRRKLTHH